jgi:diadenylate cyclase
MTVMQRLLMVQRIADELVGNVIELGTDGRLLGLQLDELLAGTEGLSELIIRDYLPKDNPGDVAAIETALGELTGPALLDLGTIARAIGHAGESLDSQVSARGYRLLAGIQRLPPTVLERLIMHFGSLQALLAATASDLQEVDGIGEARARVVREGLSRLAEASITDRFV